MSELHDEIEIELKRRAIPKVASLTVEIQEQSSFYYDGYDDELDFNTDGTIRIDFRIQKFFGQKPTYKVFESVEDFIINGSDFIRKHSFEMLSDLMSTIDELEEKKSTYIKTLDRLKKIPIGEKRELLLEK